MSDFPPCARRKRKGRPSPRRHNKTTTTTTTMYATSATRCVTRRLKIIFSPDTSRTRPPATSLARRPKTGRMVRRWNAPSGFFSTAQSDPNDGAMPAFVQPRAGVVASCPRVGIIPIDLIVDASASIARRVAGRRTPGLFRLTR